MKILAIVVIYNPNENDVINNILQYINEVDNLIIWQNTPISEFVKCKLNFPELKDKIIYMGENKNKGIAYAFNKAYEIMMVKPYSYSHLLLMDQDSIWINFKDYKNKIKKENLGSIYSPIVNNEIIQKEGLSKVNNCINSGTVIPLEVLKIIGKFNEEYSIDCVDYDFCFKANRKSVNIYKVHGCHLTQIFGTPNKSTIFNLKSYNYPPERLFFITRNHILMWRDYPDQVDSIIRKRILKD
ncbi:hypothetical protein OAM48_05830, partial [Flavobacteriaceae bacterium]|nr:hypothetical protein [Flavobacteriaceae bacterium]